MWLLDSPGLRMGPKGRVVVYIQPLIPSQLAHDCCLVNTLRTDEIKSCSLLQPQNLVCMDVALPDALVDAANAGAVHTVAAWLNEGGGVDARCAEYDGVTLLIAAAGGGREAMVRMLLQHGASVNLQSPGGVTALMDAASNGHTTVVQVLLDAKADASPQNANNYTALMIAEHYKHAATAQQLRQHAKQQTPEAKAAAAQAAATAPKPNLSGRRVRIDGLKGRPELNGCCGVAGRFDAAKGRYKVAVEGEAEAVLLKPANLQEICAHPIPTPN
jgi:hypothetical protein